MRELRRLGRAVDVNEADLARGGRRRHWAVEQHVSEAVDALRDAGGEGADRGSEDVARGPGLRPPARRRSRAPAYLGVDLVGVLDDHLEIRRVRGDGGAPGGGAVAGVRGNLPNREGQLARKNQDLRLGRLGARASRGGAPPSESELERENTRPRGEHSVPPPDPSPAHLERRHDGVRRDAGRAVHHGEGDARLRAPELRPAARRVIERTSGRGSGEFAGVAARLSHTRTQRRARIAPRARAMLVPCASPERKRTPPCSCRPRQRPRATARRRRCARPPPPSRSRRRPPPARARES